MTLSKLKPLNHLLRRSLAVSAAARQYDTVWTPTRLVQISPAAESLFHVTIDVSNSPDLAESYTKPGQYLQLRLRNPTTRSAFFSVASPPHVAAREGVFEFLVKSIAGSTAERLCNSRRGDIVELSSVIGKGFDIDRISPPEEYGTVLIFATGAGISPIRSLIEAGFGADMRSDVRLYYGARNLKRMAYQERFEEWKSSGVDIVPVLSKPDDGWTGNRGFVQAAYAREKRIVSPQSTGVVLCGLRQMAEEVTSVLVADGVPRDMILKNF